MITAERPAPDQVCTTSRAHVEAVAKRHNLKVIPAGEYLYAVRKVPLLGRPTVYRCRVTA